MSLVRLGLYCTRPERFGSGPALSSLRNAVRFFQVIRSERPDGGKALNIAILESGASDLERSLREALEQEITHVLFLSPEVLLPFYSLQTLIAMGVNAVSGISWTWKPEGEIPEIFPKIGFFDPEGRPYPYFGWRAPDIFEVDWCGLDCLLLQREAVERISGILRKLCPHPPALRISLGLRSRGIPILVDSFIQCPKVVMRMGSRKEELERSLIPSPSTWLEFSKDFLDRKIPHGPLHDPAYRGRPWYREWVERCRSNS